MNTKQIVNRKLGEASKEDLVGWVKVRQEGDHFRATSGRGWHTVFQKKLGLCGCTCKDYEFQRVAEDEKCCKHLWAMFKQGIIGLTQAQIATWTARQYRRPPKSGREALLRIVEQNQRS